MYERGGYGSFRAYARSKLANLLFAYELQRRFERIGADSKSLTAHPGESRTNLDRHLRGRMWYRLVKPFARFVFIQSPEMGALPLIRVATDPNVKGGEYFGPGGFMEQRGWPSELTPAGSRRMKSWQRDSGRFGGADGGQVFGLTSPVEIKRVDAELDYQNQQFLKFSLLEESKEVFRKKISGKSYRV